MVVCTVSLILSIFLLTYNNVNAIPRVHPLNDDVSGPVVETNVGSIRGVRAEDGDYSMFMGIPFAEVDSSNPFGASTPYPPFEGIFDANDDSAICPQIEEFNHTIVGSLDCLHLNVYVPDSASSQNPLPVLVWIYGGMFSIGFAGRFLYGPSYLVRHDVILVTINYRIGPYGFMCLDIPEVPGNQGLKDQIIALRWIKENIGAFGGDNTKITLSGNSAGGMSADLHLYYGQEDLFHRIIPQSGVALGGTVVGNSNPTTAVRLAEHFNHTPDNLQDAISFLATLTSDQIIAASNEIGLSYGPCIEKEFDNVPIYITGHPIHTNISNGRNVDILIGFNNDELYVAYAQMNDEVFGMVDFVASSLSGSFNFEGEDEIFAEMKEIVTHFYFGDEDITAELRRQVINMASDFSFNHPTLRAVKKYLENGVVNLYLYLFSYDGGRNFVKHRVNVTGGGAAHADEIGYLFDISYMETPMNPEDELIVDRMTTMWANFAKYGNPTPVITNLIPVQWPRVTQEKWHFLELNSELRVSTRPYHDRMAFLDLLFLKNAEFRRGYAREENQDPQEPSAGTNVVMSISLPLLFGIKYVLGIK